LSLIVSTITPITKFSMPSSHFLVLTPYRFERSGIDGLELDAGMCLSKAISFYKIV
jgi:hypothetical protein